MVASKTNNLYANLESWATSQNVNLNKILGATIDSANRIATDDQRLYRFFDKVDLGVLQQTQLAFITQLFKGDKSGGYSSEELYQFQENLIINKGLDTSHFDYYMEHLVVAFKGVGMSGELIAEMQSHLMPTRRLFEHTAKDYFVSREERLFYALDDDCDGSVPETDIREALQAAGLRADDNRLSDLYERLKMNEGKPLELNSFIQILGSSGLLVERALKGGLAVPDFENFSSRMDEMFKVVKANDGGQQAKYIPPLAEVEEEQFGIAIVTTDGQVYLHGDHDSDFSIQSMCKPFNYCFAVEELGAQEVHKHVGNEPSGRAFNDRELMGRLYDNKVSDHQAIKEVPFNPMINAGAIMTASLVKSNEPFKDRFLHIRQQWAKMIGQPARENQNLPRFNKEMARQENFTGFNNLALGYLLMATGQLPHESHNIPKDSCPDDPDDFDFIIEPSVTNALKLYFSTCSLELTVREVASAAATLANGGVCPLTQERVLQQSTVRSCLAITEMCGMYDGSGDFFFNIGLPAKSGVGGGVMLVVPRLMGICIFSPKLDAQGNSVRGTDMAKRIINDYRLHSYDAVMTDNSRIDPRLPLSRWRAKNTSEALWAACTGDIRTLQRLLGEQINLELGDYDQRTPMHLGAAGGHIEVIEFLLEQGIRPMPDRWGGCPISDAVENGHHEIEALFNRKGFVESNRMHIASNPEGSCDNATDYGDDLAVVELLWAASENDVAGFRRLLAQGVPVHAQDYDKRTALHLAASEGHLDAVKYLIAHGHPLNVRDRWLATPLDEAVREKRNEVVDYLSQQLLINEKNNSTV